MLLYWRYLIGQYFKVLALSVAAFTSLLVVMRLEETARFASLGASWKHVLIFNLFELPHMLPVALPISCLLSAYFLFQRLSQSHELVAMRASGLSLPAILSPVLLTAGLLCCLNFYVTSEISTTSLLASRKMARELTTMNPLALLQNLKFLRQKEIFVSSQKKAGSSCVEDMVVIVRNHSNDRLNLMSAKKMGYENKDLSCNNVCFVSNLPAQEHYGFDHLLLENQQLLKMPAVEFTQLLKESSWRVSPDYLRMGLLLVKREGEKQALENALSKKDKAYRRKKLSQTDNEIARRFAMGFGPILFSLLGCTYGISINRRRSKKALLYTIGLSALALCCFVTAKESARNYSHSLYLYVLPYLVIVAICLRRLRKLSSGKES